MPMITLKHLERFYPLAKGKFFYVLRDINLEVNEGDFVSIMGPSGAGKSSLLHAIGMHDHAWSGEYYFDEAPGLGIDRRSQRPRRRMRGLTIRFRFSSSSIARCM